VHIAGRRHAGTLPSPEYIGVLPTSHHDGKVFNQIRPGLTNEDLYGDKAYQRPDAKEVADQQGLTVLAPIKKDNNTWMQMNSGYRRWYHVFASPLKPYLVGLRKKRALSAQEKYAHTKA